MSIIGINPNIAEVNGVKPASKATQSLTNYTGPSFMESINSVAKAAQIHTAHGAGASALEIKKQKGVHDEPYDFKDAEQEMLDDHIARITELLKDLDNK